MESSVKSIQIKNQVDRDFWFWFEDKLWTEINKNWSIPKGDSPIFDPFSAQSRIRTNI